MKQQVRNIHEIADIIDNPKIYRVYQKHAKDYFYMTVEFLQKKSINEILSMIQMQQLFYEILH